LTYLPRMPNVREGGDRLSHKSTPLRAHGHISAVRPAFFCAMNPISRIIQALDDDVDRGEVSPVAGRGL
jgi:hypothetical protein